MHIMPKWDINVFGKAPEISWGSVRRIGMAISSSYLFVETQIGRMYLHKPSIIGVGKLA